jgi:hypothetical protein
MSIEEVRAERLAQLFYHSHQSLLADGNASSAPQTEGWDQVPQQERKRLVSAARLTLWELSTEDSTPKLEAISPSRVKRNGVVNQATPAGPISDETAMTIRANAGSISAASPEI